MTNEGSAGQSAAWEWRAFWPADGDESLPQAAQKLAAHLGREAPRIARGEEDCYLIAPRLRHNLKLRRGALELKVLRCSLEEGFSLWEDKRSWVFPIDAAETRRLWNWLPDWCAYPPGALRSSDEFVDYLRHLVPDVQLVSVQKQRVRLDLASARLEVASLMLPGDLGLLLSCCVDGYDLGAVRELVRSIPLYATAQTMSYVELLGAAQRCSPTVSKVEISG
ncbi:MAG: hypothetical protein NVSMB2_07770 [Chloroflexota bacterium]